MVVSEYLILELSFLFPLAIPNKYSVGYPSMYHWNVMQGQLCEINIH